MALPTSRERTYAAGSQVPSADLNKIQDVLIGVNNLLTGVAQSFWTSVKLAVPLLSSVEKEVVVGGPSFSKVANNTATYTGSIWTFSTPPNDVIHAQIQGLSVGDRITKITWHFNKASNASPMSMALNSKNGTTSTDRDTLSDSSSGASEISVTRSAINYTVLTGDMMRLIVTVGATVATFNYASVFYDHPV